MNALEMSRIPKNETNALPSPCFDAPNYGQRTVKLFLPALARCLLKKPYRSWIGTKKPLPLTGLLQNIAWEGLRSHKFADQMKRFIDLVNKNHMQIHACAWFNLKVTTTCRSMREKSRRRKWGPNRAWQWTHIITQQILNGSKMNTPQFYNLFS